MKDSPSLIKDQQNRNDTCLYSTLQMLSTSNTPLKKLNILSVKKKNKVDVFHQQPSTPMAGNVSLDNLACLVKRLSVQIDDLETWKEESKTKQKNEEQQTVLIKEQLPQQNHTDIKTLPSHTVIDPWASYVPQNYGALLQKLEDIDSLQKCPNDCCTSLGTVASADGVPWPQPIEPFRSTNPLAQPTIDQVLDIQYTHWCTLMKCIPLMDPITSAHVKTIGLYAMREILKHKASTTQRKPSTQLIDQQQFASEPLGVAIHPTIVVPTKLRESMSCLGFESKLAAVPHANIPQQDSAVQDMPLWMSTSETKTALESVDLAQIPEPETLASTPSPSHFSSPQYHTGKRFQKWLKYKRSKAAAARKTNTDTVPTPLAQSQTLRKIGSWLF